MGREIRRVPPNWQHPKKEYPGEGDYYQPMHDESFAAASREWEEGFAVHKPGDHDGQEYWVYSGGPPNPEYYREEWPEGAATWYQVYETLSEGSPVTPPFETEAELVEYLVEKGDFWRQNAAMESNPMFPRPSGGFTREQAEAFVYGGGYVPSLTVAGGGCEILPGIEAAPLLAEKSAN